MRELHNVLYGLHTGSEFVRTVGLRDVEGFRILTQEWLPDLQRTPQNSGFRVRVIL